MNEEEKKIDVIKEDLSKVMKNLASLITSDYVRKNWTPIYIIDLEESFIKVSAILKKLQ